MLSCASVSLLCLQIMLHMTDLYLNIRPIGLRGAPTTALTSFDEIVLRPAVSPTE